MTQRRRTTAKTLAVATALVLSVALGVFVLGAPAGASHTDDGANYTVFLPNEVDHLPGDENPEGASIQHNAVGEGAFDDIAPNGFETFDRLEIRSDEIDFSACESSNTAVLGVDRGNNNSGTQIDTDLLQHMKESDFREDGIEVLFYDESDFGGDPTHLRPEDAIVALQGDGSAGGPCYTMPEDPGWYQINGILEGTIEGGEEVTIDAQSHYFPICDGCHDEDTAREELGAPPSEDGTDDDTEETPTPTQTPTPTPTQTPDEAGDSDDETSDGDDETEETPTPEPEQDDETPTPSPEPEQDDGTDEEAGDSDDGDAVDGNDGSMPGTPTPADGPGFGALATLGALLAAALLAHRRD